jgi:hypothetical protein
MTRSHELPPQVHEGLRGADPANVFLAEKRWRPDYPNAFDAAKKSLTSAFVLILPDKSSRV